MQFSCNQDTFSKYLGVISRVSSSKPGLPILSNVLFEAENGKLSMSATDLEIGVHCWIGAEVKAEGKITVPAKQLSEFVNSVPAERIDVALDKQMLSVNTVNNSAEFNTTIPDDFPAIATVKKEKPLLKIPRKDLIEAIGKVAFACAKDDIKPVLTGIKVEISENILALVSADGLRLSRYIIKLSSPIETNIDLLIPAKAMEELLLVITEFYSEDGDDDVTLYLIEDKNQIIFRFNDVEIISRLIDGQFPDYKVIIPTSYQTRCEMKRSEVLNSLKVANIIARNVVGNKIFLNIDPKKNTITLSASQSEVGSNKSSFDSVVEGSGIDMAFSGRFLTEVLTNIDEEDIVFECTTAVSPGVFRMKGNDDFIHLVMPMRL